MTFRFQATAVRQCSRCREELTDPASVQCGVGPICRKKDNKLLALTIPARFSMVHAFLGTAVEMAPEVGLAEEPLKVLRESFEEFHNRTVAVAQDGEVVWAGMDLRGVIRNIDWILSWSMPPQLREYLILAVEHCGYPALAAVFRGQASLGECSFTWDTDRGVIRFIAKRNKPGGDALRTKCQARLVKYPSYVWEVKPEHLQAFVEVVRTHYPMFTGSLEDLEAQVKAAPPQPPAKPTMAVKNLPGGVTCSGEYLQVQEDMDKYLSAFKTAVPWNKRTYQGRGTWFVSSDFYQPWKQIADQFYQVQVVR